jgi:hypothetical protein
MHFTTCCKIVLNYKGFRVAHLHVIFLCVVEFMRLANKKAENQ